MAEKDRNIAPTEHDFVAAGSVPIEAVSALEDAPETGGSWIHRAGVRHYHETLEDSVQLEVKAPPRKPWR